MGRFLNPGNEAFSEVIHSKIYVDKTPLLEYTNKVISTTSKFICSSRPRRFGKSITAEMLSAYYSKGCDSRALFADYSIKRLSGSVKKGCDFVIVARAAAVDASPARLRADFESAVSKVIKAAGV